MAKRYIKIGWENKPSVKTPVNMANLGRMDKGIDDCDNAIEEIYSKRVNNVVTTNEDTFLAGPVGKVLQDQVTELNKNSTEIKTVTSPIGNIVWGGYIKVGAVVIVNVKLTTTVAVSPNDDIVSGLPYSVTNAAMRILNAYTGTYLDGWLSITHIKSGASIPSGAILNISCCYLSS